MSMRDRGVAFACSVSFRTEPNTRMAENISGQLDGHSQGYGSNVGAVKRLFAAVIV